MKKWILGLAVFVALFVAFDKYQKKIVMEKGSEDDFATWIEFVPASGLFKVKLPMKPQYGKDSVPIPHTNLTRRYDIYASEKVDGTLFLISVITYPKEADISSVDEIFKQNLDALLISRHDNKLHSIASNAFHTYKSIDFQFGNKDFDILGKEIQSGHIMYMLTYITRKDELDHQEFKRFIDSFEILNQPE